MDSFLNANDGLNLLQKSYRKPIQQNRFSSANDVPVYFQVGGEEVPISTANLQKYPNSTLAKMNYQMEKGSGRLVSPYIDRDPKLFRKKIANYLRYGEIQGSKSVNKNLRLCDDLEFYGLTNARNQINCKVIEAEHRLNKAGVARVKTIIDIDDDKDIYVTVWNIKDKLYEIRIPKHPQQKSYDIIQPREGSSKVFATAKGMDIALQTLKFGIKGVEILFVDEFFRSLPPS